MGFLPISRETHLFFQEAYAPSIVWLWEGELFQSKVNRVPFGVKKDYGPEVIRVFGEGRLFRAQSSRHWSANFTIRVVNCSVC